MCEELLKFNCNAINTLGGAQESLARPLEDSKYGLASEYFIMWKFSIGTLTKTIHQLCYQIIQRVFIENACNRIKYVFTQECVNKWTTI